MSAIEAFDSFQGDFNAKDYISKLYASSPQPAATDFDPVPLINCFEANILELKRFYLTIEKRVAQLTLSIEGDQGEVSQKVETLGMAYDEVLETFSELNVVGEKISGISVRIGKQIKSVQHEKTRAEEARLILGYFLELNSTGKCSRLDSLMMSGVFESKLQLAALLRKLNHLAKSDIPDSENASRVIRSAYTNFESETLTAFMNAFGNDDIPAMKDASCILIALNDASSCIKVFIDRHAFFQQPYDCSQVRNSFFAASTNARIPVDFSSPAGMDNALMSTFDLILRTISADWKYLDEVFEEPRGVMDLLLKRVFEEIITRHIDEGLKQAGLHSTAQYLRYLSSSFSGALEFVERIVFMYREHMDDLPATALDGAVEETKGYFMRLHKDVFERYIKISDIQTLEARFIKELIDICAAPILNCTNAKKAYKASKNLFNLGTTPEFKVISSTELQQRCSFYTFRGQKLLLEQPIEQDQQIVALGSVLRLFQVVSEAVSRMNLIFQDRQELSDLLENYLNFFFDSLRKHCILPVFQFNVENEETGAVGKSFDPKNLILIKSLNSILGAVQVYFEDQIIPMSALVSPLCCRHMLELKNSFFDSSVRYINKLLKVEVTGIGSHLTALSQKLLKRSDFRPKVDDLSAFNSRTQFCTAAKEYLRGVSKAASAQLPSANATKFLNRIGKIFFEQLIDVIKKLSFSDMGALVLLNDINAYTEMVSEFGRDSQRELGAYFGFLRELANVLLVKPENLRSVMQEGSLNIIDIRLLYPFLALRSDFKASKIDSLFPDVEGEDRGNTGGGSGFF